MAYENYCFSPDYVVYRREFVSAGGMFSTYRLYRYFFATHTTDNILFGGPGMSPMTVPDGTVINVRQFSSNIIERVFVYGTAIGGFAINNAKLLKAESNIAGSIDYSYIDLSSKNAIDVSEPTLIPCLPVFSLPTDQALVARCDGYNRLTYYHDGDGGVNIEVEENSSICGYVAPSENTDLTINQLVRIEHCEPSNPLMLVWKNSLGGWDSWLFSKKQVINTKTDSRGYIGNIVWDIESAESIEDEIGKEKSNSIILGAENLSVQEKIGIEQILSSNIVYQLFKDGSKRRVSIAPGSFISLDTDSILQSIEFEIYLSPSYTIDN